jgi:hypothetical protein
MSFDTLQRQKLSGFCRYLAAGMLVCSLAAVTSAGITRAEPSGNVTQTQQSPALSVNWEDFSLPEPRFIAALPPRPPKIPPSPFAATMRGYPPNSSPPLDKNFIRLPDALMGNPGRHRRSPNRSYRIDLRGDGLITFSVDAETLAGVVGSGETLGLTSTGAPAGPGPVTSDAISRILPSVVNMNGVVDAGDFLTSASGDWILAAPPGKTLRR